ncbi:hypothetical protein P8452_20068 [Trifolium repens]|nr:hypothetical protein P8452_20068 [Trifolium repens]
MPLIIICINTLSSTTCLSIFAMFLACTTIMLIISQIHALIVTTCSILGAEKIANLVVFVTMNRCIRVLS